MKYLVYSYKHIVYMSYLYGYFIEFAMEYNSLVTLENSLYTNYIVQTDAE